MRDKHGQAAKPGNIISVEDIIVSSGITMETGGRGDAQTDEAELRAAILEEARESDDGAEYEYVPISEVSNGIGAKVVGALREYYVVIGIALAIIICLLLSAIGQSMKSVFIAIAFGLLVLGGSYILYEAWQDKKRAEQEYRHAKSVIEPVKRKMKEQHRD